MTSPGKTVVAWTPDETRRFYRAFHKHGLAFDKVSSSVGAGRGPEQCEALHRQHQAYLSLDKKFQSEVAFIAMVQDAIQHLSGLGAEERAANEGSDVVRTATFSAREGGGDAESTLDGPAVKEETAVGSRSTAERTLASTRARRTPRPSAALTPHRLTAAASGARTPVSSAKRARASASRTQDRLDGPEATASARKRRASTAGQRRLDFDVEGGERAGGPPPSAAGRRREAAAEAGGISALLALAEAETAGGSGIAGLMAASLSAGGEPDNEDDARTAGREFRDDDLLDEESEDDDIADAGAIEAGDETDDDDYYLGEHRRRSTGRRSRRGPAPGSRARGAATPTSTPGRPSGASRAPGSASRGAYGATPVRGRDARSPEHHLLLSSVRSPGSGERGGWLAMAEADLLGGGDLSNLPDLGYLTSPGLVGTLGGGSLHGFAGAHGAPSPTNPLPRLRRRKLAPERSPPVVSPFKSLFSRRHSLAGSSAAATLLAPAAASAALGDGGGIATPVEARVRRALNAPARRWCALEFFASNLDRSWLQPPAGADSRGDDAAGDDAAGARATPEALLARVGLPPRAALTRAEWAAVRAGLGRPRRLSLRFLQEQRAELEAWRLGARERYAHSLGGAEEAGAAPEAAASQGGGARAGQAGASPAIPPARLPLPLTVGQRVIARHPATRQPHDGSVLTVRGGAVRVQFDRRELGVELVRDVDVAPYDPAENLSALEREASDVAALVINGRVIRNGKTVNLGQPPSAPAASVGASPSPGARAGPARAPAPWPAAASLAEGAAASGDAARAPQGAAAPQTVASVLAQLTLEMQKKEALVAQMRAMNEEASAGVHTDSPGGAQNPGFVQSFAQVVLQLRAVDDRIRERMLELQALGMDGQAGVGVGGVAGLPPTAPGLAPSAPRPAPSHAPSHAPPHAPGPDPDTLASRAFDAASEFVAACRARMDEETRKLAGGGAAAPEALAALMKWDEGDGPRLLSFVSRCLQSVVLLNWGGTGTVPLPSLAAALDLALSQLHPRVPANEPLLGEARSALAALKAQFMAAG